jgi:hypothetical protein
MNTTRNDTGFRTFTATAVAIGEGVRVKLDSNGEISAAGATDAWIGTTEHAIAASGKGTVKFRNAAGSLLFTASAAITAGAQLYCTASGKVDDAAGTSNFAGFQAVSAATADGDIIEAVPSDFVAFTASANQAVATDATSTQTLANALRTALINAGIIKGAA